MATVLRYLGLVLCTLAFIVQLLDASSTGSCSGRCNVSLDKSQGCQCNSACQRYGDCCSDYNSLCLGDPTGSRGSCKTIGQVSEELWTKDVNRLEGSDLTFNIQTKVPDKTRDDHARNPLFSHVNEAKLTGETFKTFLALRDNYNPNKYTAEDVTAQEKREEEAFLDAIMKTSVMKTLQDYLICTGDVSSQADLRSRLIKMWFDVYPRSGTRTEKDTSGFEHIMIGEFKTSSSVNGFHNWLSFYENEKAHNLNYYGYVYESSPGVIGAAFNWNNRIKTLGSFFIGVSPEFDIAMYSLCFIKYPGKSCHFSLKGTSLSIQSYTKDGHIATAYVSV
ncbi:poly(U)-specific endoribonuclease [Aplysia californica]|uniref:Uridylate-specific endoribonuclease n=1 Tax=Aplysia californica TaxID=6500 RepID=A0ABM1A4P0_APLCA|nr:poly(U)-specific endoribonuclease [Aplysia californica]